MNPGLGPFLRELRLQRGISVTDAAARAHLARRTLSRWEEGRTRPRLAELDSLLRALQAPPEAQRHAIQMLDAPRALRRVREVPAPSGEPFSLPRGGDLLRSLRHRRGWTQEQLAASVGVAQSTVLRWERSEAWPSQPVLQHLCALLGAAEVEATALAWGRFSLEGWDGRRGVALDELQGELQSLAARPVDTRSSPLADLRYLTLQARLGSLIDRSPEAKTVLADAYVAYARNLFVQNRVREMTECARRSLSLVSEDDLERRLRATIYLAEAAAFERTPFGYKQAARTLRPWVGVPVGGNTTSWLNAVLGWMLFQVGDRESAALLARRGIQVLQGIEEPAVRLHRQLPLAGILVDYGCPAEALPLLQTAETDSPADRAYGSYYLTKAYLSLGCRTEAAAAFAIARDGIEKHNLEFMRGAIEPLSRQM